jgi:DNA-binding beta-propeller fold protein YncE
LAGGAGKRNLALDAGGNIYVTNDHSGGTITVYSAGSDGNVLPIATISGTNTELSFPQGLALDSSVNIYVANFSTITVYAAGSKGNVAPIATIGGSNTGITELVGLALDSSGNIHQCHDPRDSQCILHGI